MAQTIRDEILPVLLKSFEMLGESAKLIIFVQARSTVAGHVVLYVQTESFEGTDLISRLLVCRALEREMNTQSEDSPTIYQCVLQGEYLYDSTFIWSRM
jgi:hypothetical protein